MISRPQRAELGRTRTYSVEWLESRRLLSATLSQPINNVSFDQDSGPETVDMYALFSDSNGNADLNFTVTSSAPSVVSSSILGNNLTLTPVAGRSGFSLIRMVATDPTGGSAVNTFRVQITALAARSLDVTLDAKHRSVTFVQTDHASATISFSGPGTAVAHFGGDGLKLNGAVLGGTHIEMEAVTLSNTTGKSHLSIIGARSGSSQAMIGNIIVNNSLGSLDVHKDLLIGDVQDAGALNNLNFDTAENGQIQIGSGSTRMNIGSAVDEVFSSTGSVSYLNATQWIDTDNVPESFVAAAVHGMNVKGNFIPNFEVTGTGVKGRALDHVKVRGAIGGSWFAGGKTGTLDIGAIPNSWQGQFNGAVSSITTDGNFSGQLVADSVGVLKIRGAISFGTIQLTGVGKTDLGNLTAGSIDIMQLSSSGNIGTISTATMAYATIFAGVTVFGTLPTQQSDFSSTSRIGAILLHPPARAPGFASSLIAAAKIGNLSFGSSNSKGGSNPYGVATESLDSLTYLDRDSHKSISLRKIRTDAALQSVLKARNWNLGDFLLHIL